MLVFVKFKESKDRSIIEGFGGSIINYLPNIPNIIIADIPNKEIDNLLNHEYIESVIKNFKVESEENADNLSEFNPNNVGWYHNALNVTRYWRNGITGEGVKVGIFGYGVSEDIRIPLVGGIDATGVENPDYRRIDSGTNHETHCAGIIGGSPYSIDGVDMKFCGVAPSSKVYAIKISNRPNSTSASSVMTGLDWAINEGIDIISCSWAFRSDGEEAELIKTAFQSAIDAGILIVCSARNTNENLDTLGYELIPYNINDTVVVTGMGLNYSRYEYAYGNNIDFIAPALSIWAYDGSNTSLSIVTGNSYGTPLIAGIFALYKQKYPNKTWGEIYEIVKDNTLKIDGQTGWDMYRGWGLPQPNREILNIPSDYSFIIRRDGNKVYEGNSNRFIDNSLTKGNKHVYELQVITNQGVSNPVELNVTAKKVEAPQQPSGFMVDNVSHNSVSLKWNLVNTAKYYIVYRWTLPDYNDERVYGFVTDNSMIDYDVSPSTGYYYEVQSVDGKGIGSDFSSYLEVTTQPQPEPKPEPTITTDGLFGYWHHRQGVNGNVWNNIAPDTVGQYNGSIQGATLNENGMYFDGLDDFVDISSILTKLNTVTPLTIDLAVIIENASSSIDILSNSEFGGFVNLTGSLNNLYLYLYSSDWSNDGEISTKLSASSDIQYFTFTYDPNVGELKLYRNGQLLSTKTGLPNNLTAGIGSSQFGIGALYGGSGGESHINIVRLYEKVLSDEEVMNNYLAGEEVGLPKIVTDGLVSYYNSKQGLDGNTWQNIAPSSQGQDSAIINGATWTQDGMYFDGVDDRVTIPIPDPLKTPASTTFEFWFKDGQNIDAQPVLISDHNGLWGLYIGESELWIRLFLENYSNIYDFGDYIDTNLRNTHHMAIVVDVELGSYKVYIDSVLVLDRQTTIHRITPVGDNILLSYAYLDPFNGIIDSVKFYNRTLSPSEIQQNYSVGMKVGL